MQERVTAKASQERSLEPGFLQSRAVCSISAAETFGVGHTWLTDPEKEAWMLRPLALFSLLWCRAWDAQQVPGRMCPWRNWVAESLTLLSPWSSFMQSVCQTLCMKISNLIFKMIDTVFRKDI